MIFAYNDSMRKVGSTISDANDNKNWLPKLRKHMSFHQLQLIVWKTADYSRFELKSVNISEAPGNPRALFLSHMNGH